MLNVRRTTISGFDYNINYSILHYGLSGIRPSGKPICDQQFLGEAQSSEY
ncbi:MAG: hypothetical protein NMK33_03815 [Candidatus Cardinium sp.]|nr:hypothetical protein [Cardinium endosymbiont of Dermatophagoides farinae]UWW96559.1 MAG: hypothetical protein NMK33_03815 [Candidatus Cardinium sp.]